MFTSITSSSAEPGAVTTTGTLKIVSFWSGMLTGTLAIRFDCQSPPGNAAPWFAYRLTVAVWVPPIGSQACGVRTPSPRLSAGHAKPLLQPITDHLGIALT